MPECLDLRGLRCPIPVIRLEARMRVMRPGETVEVIADDPIARVDLPHAAFQAGFRCDDTSVEGEESARFLVAAPVK